MRLEEKLFSHATFFSSWNLTCTLTFFITKSENLSRREKGHRPISSAFSPSSTARFNKEAALGQGVTSFGNAFPSPYPDTRKEKNDNWHPYYAQSFQSTFTLNKKNVKKNSPQNNLMPCWQTHPVVQAHSYRGHEWQLRGPQRHRIRELVLCQALL